MPERIPQRIDHYRYTDKAMTIEGELPQKALARLTDVVTDNSGSIRYRLEFGIDAAHNRYLRGRISTQVVLQCQRCLQNYKLNIECPVALAFVHTDIDVQRAEDSTLDAFFVAKKELVDPRILIEDEILLALPQIPSHSLSDKVEAEICYLHRDYPSAQKNSGQMTPDATGTETVDSDNGPVEKENPFAILKKLQQ